MRELCLDDGKAKNLKNKYNIEIKIGRRNDRYFIICDSKTRGPFKKVFLKKENGYEFLVGYNLEESKIYSLSDNGLSLVKKEKIGLTQPASEINFDDCSLITKIDSYYLFMDENSMVLFVVDANKPLETIDKYEKFNTYDELIQYYKDTYGISLYTEEANTKILKHAHILINFTDLYKSTINLTLNQLSEEILFDILTERYVMKKIFNLQKKGFLFYVTSTSKKEELIKEGYTELTCTGYETLLKKHPQEMKFYFDILQNKISELKKDCGYYIKKSDNFSLYKLESHLLNLSIKNLPQNVCAEISANRPLTKGIFASMLCACFDKLENDGFTIKDSYRQTSNFKAAYPSEYAYLWDLAVKKLPDLYTEYFENRKKLYSN